MLFDFLSKEAESARSRLALVVLLPGVVSAALVALIQAGVYAGSAESTHLFITFCVLCVLQMVCAKKCAVAFLSITEEALCKIRCRIANKIRLSEFASIEKIGDAEIYTRLTAATTTISNNIWSVVVIFESAIMILIILLYISTASMIAFICISSVYGIGLLFLLNRRRIVRAMMIKNSAVQVGLFSYLVALLKGTKEVRLRTQRGDELLADVRLMAASLKEAPIQINRTLQQNFVFARMILFLLLAALVFVLPHVSSSQASLLNTLSLGAILLFAPLTSIMRSIPEYERAEMAVEGILKLEGQLEQAAAPESPDFFPSSAPFQVIEALDLGFVYQPLKGGPSFSLGPLSLTLHSGEIVFFVGGNGSGKTTLLKLLSGLYSPSSGSLRLDGVPLGPHNRQSYRELIAAIFTDFHLFKKLYGLPEPEAQHVQSLLEQMQLQSQVAYTDEGFSRLELSTGQRKRLAMLVALLEDRPLYIFDEWAADQDPEFRKYYYEELLPELKRRGKTVWAISHDDRYFHCADRVVTLEYGSIRSIVSHPRPPEQTLLPAARRTEP